jgi:hypothetical protein
MKIPCEKVVKNSEQKEPLWVYSTVRATPLFAWGFWGSKIGSVASFLQLSGG